MTSPQYVRGEFRPYKAVTKVHLGALESDLEAGEVVLYDGTTMRRGPDEVQLATLRAAIKVGWLIPEADEGAYIPRPAGVEIRPAESRGRERGPARVMGVVEDEEREVGGLDEVRAPGAPKTHQAKQAALEIQPDGKPAAKAAPKRERSAPSESSQEGRVVGRFKTSAKSGSVEVGKDDRRIKSQIDNTEGVQIDRLGTAGDDLEDVLPEAASTGKPDAGVAGEGESQASSDDRAKQITSDAEARRQARLAAAKASEKAVAAEASGDSAIKNTAVKVENTSGKTIDATASVSKGSEAVGFGNEGEVIGKIGKTSTTEEPPVVESDPAEEVPSDVLLAAKLDVIRQFVPGFDWDLKAQWRSRVKKALEYKDNMPVLNAILSIETEAVRKHVMKALYGND